MTWWINNLNIWNGKAIITPSPDLMIETDASMKGWGAHCNGATTQGMWSSSEQKMHINCLELTAAFFCSESIHKNIEIQTCPPSSRQYYNSGSNKQNGGGGHKVKSSVTDNTTVVGLLSTEHDHSYCRTLTRGTECDRRQGVESIPRFEQLGVEQTHFSPDRRVLGSHRGRSICGQIDRAKTQICQLESRSRSTGSRCSDIKLGSNSGVCLPSILPNRQVLGENKERSSISDSRHSSVAKPAMVLANTDIVDRPSNFIATNERVVEVASRGNLSAINNRAISVSRMETLRQRLKTEGFSEESADLLLESRRAGTQVAYIGPWKKWCGWCSKRKINPLQATVGQLAGFLARQLKRGLEYSTINTYRSAISAFHPSIAGIPVGQHPRIKQLLKGVFNRNPPAPKYLVTWNVDIVLKYLKNMGPNTRLNIKQLSLKLAMLMALTSASIHNL